MTKKKSTPSKAVRRMIYLADYHFKRPGIYNVKKSKNVIKWDAIIIKDVLITIEETKTPAQIKKVMDDDFYKIKALRVYFKLEGKVFNQQEALEKYIPLKIDFKKELSLSFAPIIENKFKK